MSAALIEVIVAIVGGLLSGGGFLFALLRYHREEATAVIAQHSEILEDMRAIYEAMKDERDELLTEVRAARTNEVALRNEISALRDELRSMKKQLAEYTNGG